MSRKLFPRLEEIASNLLRESVPRAAASSVQVRGDDQPVVLSGCEERAAAAVGSLLVLQLIEHGGCALPVGPAREAARRLLETFPETDRRRLETEAVEIVRWLEDSLNLLGDDWLEVDDRGVYPWEDREFPDEGKTVLIRRAIREKSDLEIEYFTYSRNTLTHRRITPLEIEADGKLRALCHWRRDERHFQVRRIRAVREVASAEAGAPQAG